LNRTHGKSEAGIFNYLRYNLVGGLKTLPRRGTAASAVCFLVYIAMAVPIGFGSGIVKPVLAGWQSFLYMPLTLMIFPSLLEEAFFFSLLSSLLFVAWHPFNALTINPGARDFFLDPWFLLITFLLGLSCSLGYIYTRSLWTPVLMHWLTVAVWVLFLGGRNLLL
jgi:uncharacterized protein